MPPIASSTRVYFTRVAARGVVDVQPTSCRMLTATSAEPDDDADSMAPSRHVRITFKRRARGELSQDDWLPCLQLVGDVEHVLALPQKAAVYVSYVSSDGAAQCVTACKTAAGRRAPGTTIEPSSAAVEAMIAALPGPVLHGSIRAAYYNACDLPEAAGLDEDGGFVTNAAVHDQYLHSNIPWPVYSSGTPPIPGLLLVHDFISAEEELELLTAMDAAPWIDTMRRRVQHYGHGFDYISRRVMGADAAVDAAAAEAAAATGAAKRVPAVRSIGGALGALVERMESLGCCGDEGGAALALHPLDRPLPSREALDAHLVACGVVRPEGGHPHVDQVTVNEYTPGQGIGPHVDTHDFQDGVVSVSLLGDICMEFKYAAREVHSCGSLRGCSLCAQPVQLWLPRRSLLLIRGEARYAWAHSIAARRVDVVDGCVRRRPARRISVTCRRIRGYGNPCTCAWGSVCFDQEGGATEPTDLHSPALRKVREESRSAVAAAVDARAAPIEVTGKASKADKPRSSAVPEHMLTDAGPASSALSAPLIEREHVHALYDAIADHFSHTRHSPWPRVEAFLKEVPAGAVVVDVGCGNGKYLRVNPLLAAIGSDRSAPLAHICSSRGHEAFVADAVSLPLRSQVADVTLCIAVLHHIATHARRIALITELLRVTRPGGSIFVQAWALEQGADSRRAFESQDVFVPWNLQPQFTGSDGAAEPPAVFQRYCHVYRKGELEELLAEAAAAAGLRVVVSASWWDRDNWALIAQRGEG